MASGSRNSSADQAANPRSTSTTLDNEDSNSEQLKRNNVDGGEMQGHIPKFRDSTAEKPPPQKPEDHVVDSEAVPTQEDESAARATQDLEALHPVPSGPMAREHSSSIW